MRLLLTRTVLATVVLTVTQMVGGMLLLRGEPQVPGVFGWWLLSNLLTSALVVSLAGQAAGTKAWRMGLVFAVLFGIPANYLAETLFFDIGIAPSLVARNYMSQLLASAVTAGVVGSWSGAGPERKAPPAWSRLAWAGRIALGALAYVVAYFTAGFAVYPYVADFYAGRIFPSLGSIALMQAGRGLGFVLVLLVLTRTLRASRLQTAVAAGLTLSIIGGIAPLLVPNAFLPAPVRLAHLVETGVSNFLFGAFVGWLLDGSLDARTEEGGVAAAATLRA